MIFKRTNFRTPYVKSNKQSWLFLKKNNWISLLFYKTRSLGGLNKSGQRVLRTKSSITKSIYKLQLYKGPLKKRILLGLPLEINTPIKKRYTIAYENSGIVTILPTTFLNTPFLFLYPNINLPNLNTLLPNPVYAQLYNTTLESLLSFLQLTPLSNMKYARSLGSYAKLLTKNIKNHLALIKLPSGIKKLFSIFSIGWTVLGAKKIPQLFVKKAGYLSKYGKKPKVRGVAMNPVDHPHGGRTKSIKYPRTPWGKTTKFK